MSQRRAHESFKSEGRKHDSGANSLSKLKLVLLVFDTIKDTAGDMKIQRLGMCSQVPRTASTELRFAYVRLGPPYQLPASRRRHLEHN